MAVGSFATATNDSPSASARAPMPILRNEPDEVPARCSPSLHWARAVEALPTSTTNARAAAHTRRSEVIVERHPPLRPRAVVRRIVHVLLAQIGVVPRVGEQRRVVGAHPPDPPSAAHRVHPVD